MPDINIDSKNHFYLGREHDLETGETSDTNLLYKSKDLTTHAVCVGMTGSGKTGLCVSLLEEAALDGIPAIIIDPKGDLGNLMLGFPDLKSEDFRPWIDESVAERKDLTPEQFAEKTADMWRKGLADWGQGPERIQKLNDKVERVIYTPGASHGIPLTVLKSFNAPPKVLRDDFDAFRQRISSAASGLLALLGIDADPVRSREHILLSTVLKVAWEKNKDLDIAAMIAEIMEPSFEKVGVMDLETFYPKKSRVKLAMELNNLLASPSFAGWMRGRPLNINELFYSPEGKPRQSIISIAHLDDSQRMFFVTILLNEVLAWMRTQPGTGSLKALLYMDEVFGYFPPTANPPSKLPMLTLLKQARAFGLGCILATQNPVDLDYKGLSNMGTWFLGRLQTERDKMRVMEGLEGAAAEAGGRFDKQAMERKLASLGSRVFLMNNVHDDSPTVFHTRWAMSYLAGPLAQQKIKTLMDRVRDKFPLPSATKVAKPKEADAKQDESSEEKPTDEKPVEEKAADPVVESSRNEAEVTAKYKAKYAVRIRDAKTKDRSKWREFMKQFCQVPVQAVVVMVRFGVFIAAQVAGGATKRKGNSVGSASKSALTELTQAGSAWSNWKSASDELWDLKQECQNAIDDELGRSQQTVDRPKVWLKVLLLAGLVTLVGIGVLLLGAWYFGLFSSKTTEPADTAARVPNISLYEDFSHEAISVIPVATTFADIV